MPKIALVLAGAAAALGLAAPASAQFYGAPYAPYAPVYAPRVVNYGFATPAIVGNMEARIARIRAQVRDLSLRGRLGFGKARNLDRQAFSLQRQVRNAAWNGISPGERYSLELRIANLERRVQIAALRPQRYMRHAGYRW